MGLLAVIELSFDPAIRVGDLLIRWQTVGATLALLWGMTLAVKIGDDQRDNQLHLDDVLYIILAVVPGAVVGGRVVHGLVFWDVYLADPVRLFDVSAGSLSLTGAVLGGTASAVYVARLIGAPVRRWADVLATPLLVALGLGKFAQLLGGSGQGAPFDGPWAVAFTGPGVWISPNPSIPAHPSQVYEGLWLLLGIGLMAVWLAARRRRLRHEVGRGRLFAFAMVWFMAGRILVGFTWRDEPLVGPLNVEQAVAIASVFLIGMAASIRGRSNVERNTTLTPMERRP